MYEMFIGYESLKFETLEDAIACADHDLGGFYNENGEPKYFPRLVIPLDKTTCTYDCLTFAPL